MFKGVVRLPEGTYLEWKNGRAREHRYYANNDAPVRERQGTSGDDEFERVFSDAVKAWMVADVPVGAYLSGGVDSSVIVSEMRRLTARSRGAPCASGSAAPPSAGCRSRRPLARSRCPTSRC